MYRYGYYLFYRWEGEVKGYYLVYRYGGGGGLSLL